MAPLSEDNGTQEHADVGSSQRPTEAPVGNWKDEPKCLPWRGKPEHYQEQAAIAAVEGGIGIMPWCWIETDCGNPLCIESTHLLIRRPQRLEYPYAICVYCGQAAWTKDHLLPVGATGVALRRHVLTVPACSECNTLIGASYAPSITERRAIAKAKLRKKHWKKITAYEYSDEEIREFGPGLRPTIIRAKAEKEAILERLAFPEDMTFDLRYLGKSGIDDPYALGLLKAA